MRKMFGKFTYLILMLIFMGIPLLITWLSFFKLLLKYKKIYLYVIFGSLIFGWAWDFISIKDDVWNYTNILGVWFLGLPVEDWLATVLVGLFVASLTLLLIGRGGK